MGCSGAASLYAADLRVIVIPGTKDQTESRHAATMTQRTSQLQLKEGKDLGAPAQRQAPRGIKRRRSEDRRV